MSEKVKDSLKDSLASFDNLRLSADLRSVVKELGYETMTPIQAQSIPLLLSGKDIVAQSQTGSGKTAAFSLPILENLKLSGRQLQALILCPTRELCTQVAREIRKLGRRHPGLQALVVCGGQPFGPQASALQKGVHIVVATPGRLVDHLNRETIDLSAVEMVVLDEADRMLDMGFEEDMERILGAVPARRQTAFFSATYPNSIATMSASYQKNPIKVVIEAKAATALTIEQVYYEVESDQKSRALVLILEEHTPESAIIFCNQKLTTMDLVGLMRDAGISCDALNGDLEQFERDRVMARFRNGSIRILVATDVAARGIDIEALDAVINYDLPPKSEVYVHRIGRTGRAGKSGLAISLATAREDHKISSIQNTLGIRLTKRRLLDSGRTPSKSAHAAAAMTTLRIGAGRKEKLRPGDILGALTGEAGGLNGADVGKIEIHDHFAYVAVATKIAKTALARLQEGKIKGRRLSVALVD